MDPAAPGAWRGAGNRRARARCVRRGRTRQLAGVPWARGCRGGGFASWRGQPWGRRPRGCSGDSPVGAAQTDGGRLGGRGPRTGQRPIQTGGPHGPLDRGGFTSWRGPHTGQRPTGSPRAGGWAAGHSPVGGVLIQRSGPSRAAQAQWAKERTGKPNQRLIKAPHEKTLKLFEGLPKHYTSILVQMRSLRIGLKHFLFKIGEADTDICNLSRGITDAAAYTAAVSTLRR